MAWYFWSIRRRWIVPVVAFAGVAASWFLAIETAVFVGWLDLGGTLNVDEEIRLAGMAGGAAGIAVYLGAVSSVMPQYCNWRTILFTFCIGTAAGALLDSQYIDSYTGVMLASWQGLVTFALVYLGGLRHVESSARY